MKNKENLEQGIFSVIFLIYLKKVFNMLLVDAAIWHFHLCAFCLFYLYSEKMQTDFGYYCIFSSLIMIDIISRTRSALWFSIEVTQFKEVSE